MRHSTVLAASAIGGCLILIICLAALSVCWTVHPLLTVVAAVVLCWVGAHLAGWLFETGPREP